MEDRDDRDLIGDAIDRVDDDVRQPAYNPFVSAWEPSRVAQIGKQPEQFDAVEDTAYHPVG